MEYDSVYLDQQSISDKNVGLILYVWKPGYMKSGHIWYFACGDHSAVVYCIFHTVPVSSIYALYESYSAVMQLIGQIQYS